MNYDRWRLIRQHSFYGMNRLTVFDSRVTITSIVLGKRQVSQMDCPRNTNNSKHEPCNAARCAVMVTGTTCEKPSQNSVLRRFVF